MTSRVKIAIKFSLVFGLSLGLTSGLTSAQQPVLTSPVPATTTGSNASTTVVATGVFQQIWSATPRSQGSNVRKGCLILNEGTHSMYVTEGISVADSTTALAVLLVPGQFYSCGGNGVVLTGQINITGTIGESFYAAQY